MGDEGNVAKRAMARPAYGDSDLDARYDSLPALGCPWTSA